MVTTPAILKVEQQTFAFNNVFWLEVEKYDKSVIHTTIGKIAQSVQGVDVIGLSKTNAYPRKVILLEAKDYRATGKFPKHDIIVNEVCSKVIGSLSGISLAARLREPGFDWRLAARRLSNVKDVVFIILHVESGFWTSADMAKVELITLAGLLEGRLKSIQNCRVAVVSEWTRLIDCKVTTP